MPYADREIGLARKKAYYLENREKLLSTQRDPKYRKIAAARRRKRWATDPTYAKKISERNRLAHIKRQLKKNPDWAPTWGTATPARKRQLASARNKKYQMRHKTRLAPIQRQRGREQYWKHRDKCLVRMKAYRAASPEQFREYEALRRAQKLLATPSWVNRRAIRDFYAARKVVSLLMQREFHVDHIVPLVSDFVCGLHVENNLQLLPGPDNQSKSNRFWPDMW